MFGENYLNFDLLSPEFRAEVEALVNDLGLDSFPGSKAA